MVRTRLTRRRAMRRLLNSDEELQAKRRVLIRQGCAICHQPAHDVHHRKRRSQGGDHSWSNLMPVCRWHHDVIGHYPAYAHLAGYVVLRHEDPASVPVLPLASLPVAARLRLTRPAYDWRERQRLADLEHDETMGPEWP
jgi:hypothetical protein